MSMVQLVTINGIYCRMDLKSVQEIKIKHFRANINYPCLRACREGFLGGADDKIGSMSDISFLDY